MTILRAVLIGLAIAMVGTIPRNILYFANIQFFNVVPWAVPLVAIYMWYFWRHLQGSGPTALIRETGADSSFWMTGLFLLVMTAAAVWAYLRLARITSQARTSG